MKSTAQKATVLPPILAKPSRIVKDIVDVHTDVQEITRATKIKDFGGSRAGMPIVTVHHCPASFVTFRYSWPLFPCLDPRSGKTSSMCKNDVGNIVTFVGNIVVHVQHVWSVQAARSRNRRSEKCRTLLRA